MTYRTMAVAGLPSFLNLLHSLRCVCAQVAGSKSRFTEDDFDLNLTYITDRLIAMGLPAEASLVKMTRNPISETSRFFETRHEAHYRVYNLCIEKVACKYDILSA